MKRIFIMISIGALAAQIAGGAPEKNLLPAAEGNYWILESSIGDRRIIVCEPSAKQRMEVAGLSEWDVGFYGTAKSAKLYRRDPVRGVYRPVMRLQAAKKRERSFGAGDRICEQLRATLEPVSGVIWTATGAYTNCVALTLRTADMQWKPCDLLKERMYLAPGVGPVALQGRGGRVYGLVEAQVGGQWFGVP